MLPLWQLGIAWSFESTATDISAEERSAHITLANAVLEQNKQIQTSHHHTQERSGECTSSPGITSLIVSGGDIFLNNLSPGDVRVFCEQRRTLLTPPLIS